MIKKSITPKDVVDLLNEMLRLDPKGTQRFIETRVKVNMAIADHPTIQVRKYPSDPFPVLGPIGFLNGLFGTMENRYGVIAAEYPPAEKKQKPLRFKVSYLLGPRLPSRKGKTK